MKEKKKNSRYWEQIDVWAYNVPKAQHIKNTIKVFTYIVALLGGQKIHR